MAEDTFHITVAPEQSGSRLDRILAGSLQDVSRARLQDWIRQGHVKLYRQQKEIPHLSPSATPLAGDEIIVSRPPNRETSLAGEDISLDILFEDDHILVLNKAAGMVVHPGAGHDSGTLVHALIAHCGDSLTGIGGETRPGIVHRLDKDTSGVMVAAKTAIAHQRLSVMFAEHDLTRRYTALVWGILKERNATIDAPIGRNTRDRKKMAILAKGRDAVTHIHAARVLPPLASVVECVLETGRTHQIRVHMAHIGHGVIGDPSYGRPMRAGQMPDQALRDALAGLRAFPRQALHASHLGFDHPITGEALGFDTPLPADMEALIKGLEDAIAKRGKAKPLT